MGVVKTIDLRSDTTTKPTDAMRNAMASAEVGDDVYGEDPSVNRLQERAAQLLGKEAALFVSSGTMANQTAIAALTRPGDTLLATEDAHILIDESGAASALWGVQVLTIGSGGRLSGSDVSRAIAPADIHCAPTRLLTIENTHNRSGGLVLPLEGIEEAIAVAREHGLATHLDGARLFNAVAATGIPADRWARQFDTATFCLSKGLGAPVGSVICGSAEVIERARLARKRLGGGMRQAGIIAAAGLYALENHRARLVVDHENARRLARGLQKLGFNVNPLPETNMVLFRPKDEPRFLRETESRKLLFISMGGGLVRAATHLDISETDIEDALNRIAEFVAAT
jgi:threonine aldolase